MKHNYVKIFEFDFKLLQLYLKVDKLANIFINNCQICNNNSMCGSACGCVRQSMYHTTLPHYFVTFHV